jgi:hypothetical protein
MCQGEEKGGTGTAVGHCKGVRRQGRGERGTVWGGHVMKEDVGRGDPGRWLAGRQRPENSDHERAV